MNGNNPGSTASIAGHPIHPMLVPFPVAFLVTALVTDFIFWRTVDEIWATASAWLLGAGVIMALVAALFGFTDFLGDARIRDISASWQHLIGNLIAVLLAFINPPAGRASLLVSALLSARLRLPARVGV
jgi:uncharacterized membrane protein